MNQEMEKFLMALEIVKNKVGNLENKSTGFLARQLARYGGCPETVPCYYAPECTLMKRAECWREKVEMFYVRNV